MLILHCTMSQARWPTYWPAYYLLGPEQFQNNNDQGRFDQTWMYSGWLLLFHNFFRKATVNWVGMVYKLVILLFHFFDYISIWGSLTVSLLAVFGNNYSLQIYLLTAVSLFALPTLWPSVFSGTYQTITLPYVLPIAHVGLVSITYDHK